MDFNTTGSYFYFLFVINLYANTADALRKIPPMMSVSQWTPERSLPNTINAINTFMPQLIHRRNFLFLIRVFNCIRDVGITHRTSKVVEDG